VRELTLTWGAFPRGILLNVGRGENDNAGSIVRIDASLSSRNRRSVV
jgi:hypothetical protein